MNARWRYAVRLTAFTAPEYGKFEIFLDEQRALIADFRASDEGETDPLPGSCPLSQGSHRLTFQSLDTSPSEAQGLSLEMLGLLKLPPPAVREVKKHNEAHFFRLGIGRAVHAYRLA